jgi:hypothetical protein
MSLQLSESYLCNRFMLMKLAHSDKCVIVYNTKMYWDISVAKGFVRKLNVFSRIFEVILPSALTF